MKLMTRYDAALLKAPTCPTATSRYRICRSACFAWERTSSRGSAWRSVTRSSMFRRRPVCSRGPPPLRRGRAAPRFLNLLMSLGPPAWSALRLALSRELAAEAGASARLRPHLTPMAHAEMRMPVAFRNFTDFLASVFHATNAGRLFRPDNPLTPNYKYVPLAYHSRASSVRISDIAVTRPSG